MVNCIVCDGDNYQLIFKKIREGKREVFRCNGCGFVWLAPEDETDSLESSVYYNTDAYASKCYEPGWGFDERKEKRKKSLAASIQELAGIIREKKIFSCLEVGASVGSVIEGLKENVSGINVAAVELNRMEAEYLAISIGNENVYYTLEEACESNEKYDLVYGIHVFEHFQNPLKELRLIHQLLKTDGHFYLEMPNHDDFYLHTLNGNELENYRQFMYHKAHPYYYNRESFYRFIAKTDFLIEFVKTRQDYPLTNFFHWLIKGSPQRNISVATSMGVRSDNNNAMQLISELDRRFRVSLETNGQGCSLVCLLKAGRQGGLLK